MGDLTPAGFDLTPAACGRHPLSREERGKDLTLVAAATFPLLAGEGKRGLAPSRGEGKREVLGEVGWGKIGCALAGSRTVARVCVWEDG